MNINIENLNKSYKDLNALKNLNLELKSPSMIGLVGPNGAGKTTLMKSLVGSIKQTSGNIFVDGKDFSEEKVQKEFKRKLGYLPQDFGLYDEMNVYEYLEYICCLKEVNLNRKAVIDDCIELTDLVDKRKARIKTLSGGQKQRVGIAQALLNNPDVFIVDEPTVGLDPEERVKFRNLFSRCASKKLGILSTHIIEDVQSVCGRIIVINKGEVLFDGLPTELIKRAKGHVGLVSCSIDEEAEIYAKLNESTKIVSRVMEEDKINFRVVGNEISKFSDVINPNLEDAYIYSMMGEK